MLFFPADGTAVLIGFSEPTYTGLEGGVAVGVRISTLVPPGMDPDDLSPRVTVEYFTTDGTALAGQSTSYRVELASTKS